MSAYRDSRPARGILALQCGEDVNNVRLLPATAEHLVALQSDPSAFGRLIGSPVPQGWPEFPESIDFTLDRLREHSNEGDWWMHFFLHGDALVGSGGFVGPPHDGVVEIGYEIAPAFRGNGLGTAAARALVEKARTTRAVTMVIANTLAHDNPSTGVLRRLGFVRARELVDPEEGPIWRWELLLGRRPAPEQPAKSNVRRFAAMNTAAQWP